MSDKALRGNKLTRIGFKQGGAYGPLRGTTAGGVAKSFRGKEGFKESQKLQKKLLGTKDTGLHKGSVRKATSPKVMGTQRPKTKSDFRLKHQVKQIQKSPDKKFKHQNPATEKGTTRHGFVYEKRKSAPVKGSLGKKTYIQDWKGYHHANKPKAKGGKV